MMPTMFTLLFLGVGLAIVFLVIRQVRRLRARSALTPGFAYGTTEQRAASAKGEALFQSMFPDLQPYFHPARLAEWLTGYGQRKDQAVGGIMEMGLPVPGFPEAQCCEVVPEGNQKRVRILDTTGLALSEFEFTDERFGGTITMVSGRFRVDLGNRDDPMVQFRGGDREFDWSGQRGWRFRTPVADHGFDTYDDGLRWSDDSPSSTAVAVTAGAMVAAGGTFGGAGASGAWDDTGDQSADAAQGEASASGDTETISY